MRTRIVLALGAAALLLGADRPLLAQAPGDDLLDALADQDRWRRFDLESAGLQHVLEKVVEADDGTPWALLSSGLAWYDGYEWRVVPPGNGAPTRLPGSTTIIPGTGELLMATQGRVVRGDASGFRVVELANPDHRAVAAVPADAGALLVQVYEPDGTNRLLRLIDGMEDTVSLPASMPSTRRANVYHTRSGTIWVNTERGLYQRHAGLWRLRLSAGEHGPMDIGTLRENVAGHGVMHVYLPRELRGLWRWGPSEPPQRVEHDLAFIEDVDIAPDGTALVASSAAGVQLVDLTGRVRTVTAATGALRSARRVTLAASGRLWTVDHRDLHLLAPRSPAAWQRWLPGDDAGFSHVNAILSRDDGSTWLATEAGIVVRHTDGTTRRVTSIAGEPIRGTTGIAEDEHGDVWIVSGAGFSGAYRYDGQEWTRHDVDASDQEYFFHSITRSPRGRLWLAGLRSSRYMNRAQDGIGPHVVAGGAIRPWRGDRSIETAQVYDVAEASDGTIWFATVRGLARWRRGAVTWWAGEDRLREERVTEVEIGPEGRVYFADQHYGLGEVLADDSIRYRDATDGLPFMRIWGILAEANDTVWLTGDGGVSRMSGTVFSVYGSTSGLRRKAWPIARRGNELLVGTAGGGLATMDLVAARDLDLRVAVRPPVVQGRTAVLHLDVRSPWAATPADQVEVRIRINDEPWSAWSRTREFRLEQLDPGRYAVEILARGSSGEVTPTPQRATFVVPTPLWRSARFVVPVATLAALLTLVSAYLMRSRAQSARDRRVESERYRRIFESASDIIFTTDNQERLTSINTAGLDALGYREDEVLDHPISAFVAPESQRLARQMRRAKLRGLQSTRYEITLLRKDGERIQAELTTRLTVQDRRIVGVHGIARDVSERRRAEQTLRDIAMGIVADTGTNLFRSLVESLAKGLGTEYALIATLEGEDGTPVRARTVALWDHDELVDDITYELADTPCADVVTTGLCVHVDRVRELFPRDELARQMRAESYAGTPLRSADGTALGIMAVAGRSPILDPGLTRSMLQIFGVRAAAELEQMRTESALRVKEQELQQALKMEALGRMAGGIAHDFNNLLTVVNGFAELALMRKETVDSDRDDFEQILAAGRSAARLTAQLLTFSRRETITSTRCDLGSAARGARALLRGFVRDHHGLEMKLSDASMEIPAGLAQIEQVLMNLVVNAADAMPDGGRLRITARPGADRASALLEVEDEGAGMDRRTRTLAVEPFFTTKDQGAGTGLGLSTVYGIVQQTGGTMGIDSRPGAGTRVTIRWPIVGVTEDAEASAPIATGSPEGRETILVVEDQELVSRLARRALEARGYRVIGARSGREAIRELEAHDREIDLIVSDVIMPGGSGVALAERVRDRFPWVRVVLMSGYNDVLAPDSDPGYGFLAKPFTPDELTRTVRTILDGTPTSVTTASGP